MQYGEFRNRNQVLTKTPGSAGELTVAQSLCIRNDIFIRSVHANLHSKATEVHRNLLYDRPT